MPAYIIAQVEEVLDPEGLQEYIGRVIPLMEQYSGHYIITSFQVEPLEGERHPLGLAVAEFPSREQIRAFWDSDEYTPLRELRQRSVRARISLADAPETQ